MSFVQEVSARQGGTYAAFHFDPLHLRALAEPLRDSFAEKDPFNHVVIDSFLPERVLDDVLAELPVVPRGDNNDMSPTGLSERGKTANIEPSFFGPQTTNLLYQLNAGDFLDFLESVTGIKGLISDLRLVGGGYHLTRRGGRLAVHTDFSHHPQWNIRRRLNLILYLNRDWREEYGGHLELWDKELTGCKKRVLPIFNRCVIFSTDADSVHGQPEPLACPPNRGRQSLALYYYDNPAESVVPIRTTNYMPRPGTADEGSAAKRFLKRITPPIVWDAANRLFR
jgi:Rps23 Pro-64 3,4-dihydroxylase Tpa1-like proline 4-hydroxylase